LPLRAGPVILPGDSSNQCSSVSGGNTPGLYCLVAVLVRANDPRKTFVGLQQSYRPNGPWTDFTHAITLKSNDISTSYLNAAIQMRAPSVLYLRAYATFDDGEPYLPRSAPTSVLEVRLLANGKLDCPHQHRVSSNGQTTVLCGFSGGQIYGD
jgi:hypothetical protein